MSIETQAKKDQDSNQPRNSGNAPMQHRGGCRLCSSSNSFHRPAYPVERRHSKRQTYKLGSTSFQPSFVLTRLLL
jgi:hypothetical protein